MRRKNYESDFIARVTLPTGYDGDVVMEFSTIGGVGRYIASRVDGVYKNCVDAGGHVLAVVFKNHYLQSGLLRMKVTTWRINEYAADGLREVLPTIEDIELVCGPSDDSSDIDIDLLLGYGIQDLYGIVRAKGYTGTKDEFYTTWVDLLVNGGGSGGLTEVKVSDVKSDDDAAVSLSDILRDITLEISGKAEVEHTHSGYATTAYVQEQIQNVDLDTNLFYNKTDVNALVEDARIAINLTPEQIAALNVNLTPIEDKIAEVRLFSVKDKKLLVLGDSLSSSGGGSMEAQAIGSWCQYVKNNLSLNSASRSIANGGATVTDRSDTTLQALKANWTGGNNVLSNQVYSLLNHYKANKGTANEFVPDIIMIMAGTNNINTSYPFTGWDNLVGDWDALIYDYELADADYTLLDVTTPEGLARYNKLRTFRNKIYGSWRWIIETLLTNFPNSFIYIMQPLQNGEGRGKNIFKYYDYLDKIAKYYSLPIIRCADECFLSYFSNMRSGKGWSGPWYTFDGTHPDWQGMKLVGNYASTIVRNTYFDKPAITATKTEQVVDDKYYNITVTNANDDAEIGSVAPVGVTQVKEGKSLTVAITPCEGYKVLSLTVDGAAITPALSYTFANVTANHTLLVEFALNSVPEPINYNVTAVSNNNDYGIVAPTSQVVADGETAQITATAKSGYVIESWTGSDSSTGAGTANGTATVQNVKADKNIQCKFKVSAIQPTSNKSIISLNWGWADKGYDAATGITKAYVVQSTPQDYYDVGGNVMGGIKFTGAVGINSNANILGKITGDDSAIYPDWALKQCVGVSADNASGQLQLTLPAGNYKVKILSNYASDCPWANYAAAADKCLFIVAGVSKVPTKVIDNVDTLMTWESVDASAGTIDISFSSSETNKRVALNLIEVEKIG